jgi:hypothetical protein
MTFAVVPVGESVIRLRNGSGGWLKNAFRLSPLPAPVTSLLSRQKRGRNQQPTQPTILVLEQELIRIEDGPTNIFEGFDTPCTGLLFLLW